MTQRILFIHQVGYRGGAGTMLANIIKSLDKRKFEPVVVCPAGDIAPQLERAGARVIAAPRPLWQVMHISGFSRPALHPRFIESLIRIRQDRQFWTDFIREQRADIVHLNAMTLAPMAWSAREAGARVVCSVQETSVHGWFGIRTAWLRKLLSERLDAVTFISEYDRAAAGCCAPIVEVIPNWVDLREFDRGTVSMRLSRLELGIPGDAKVILFMGGVSRLKGTLPLLLALRGLADIQDVTLLAAGYWGFGAEGLNWHQRLRRTGRRLAGTDYETRVKDLVEDPVVQQHLHCVGMRDDVAGLYAAADVVVFPSSAPHQARPVLEAGAMGKPVVVSDFPQTTEFVQHGVNGLLVRPGDVTALSSAIRQVLTNRGLANQLGEANYQATLKNHNQDENAPKFSRIYERLL